MDSRQGTEPQPAVYRWPAGCMGTQVPLCGLMGCNRKHPFRHQVSSGSRLWVAPQPSSAGQSHTAHRGLAGLACLSMLAVVSRYRRRRCRMDSPEMGRRCPICISCPGPNAPLNLVAVQVLCRVVPVAPMPVCCYHLVHVLPGHVGLGSAFSAALRSGAGDIPSCVFPVRGSRLSRRHNVVIFHRPEEIQSLELVKTCPLLCGGEVPSSSLPPCLGAHDACQRIWPRPSGSFWWSGFLLACRSSERFSTAEWVSGHCGRSVFGVPTAACFCRADD